MTASTMLKAALELAERGWEIFPCHEREPGSKAPYTTHGLLEATTDHSSITAWWTRWPGALIGARVPEPLLVLDVDPRHGGDTFLAGLEAEHGTLPSTLTTRSGGPDGSWHLWLRRPVGRLRGGEFGRAGVDLRTHANYVIVPPSLHPDTGRPYRWEQRPVADPPAWLVKRLVMQPQKPRRPQYPTFTGPSAADAFSATTSWADVLTPHGWRCLDPDPDAEGSRWLHPAATSSCSATIRNGCLFVYSTSTEFAVTGAGDPRGYTRFRAYAVLDHHGDLSAAARALRGGDRRVVVVA